MIPHQHTGAHSDTSVEVTEHQLQDAARLFERARASLLNVNRWQEIAGGGASFQLVNEAGVEKASPVQPRDYIRISLPAVQGSSEGEGYEWVRVESVDEGLKGDLAYISINVRPAVPPIPQKKHVAHFFSDDATSTFCVEKRGHKVRAAVFGRNELPNTETPRLLDRIRNFTVALGAMMGLNKPQWKSFVQGLIKKNIR
jgi:hypothetical protein